MAAQDEGIVPFDSLPLAQLKTFIEDVVALNPGTALVGPQPSHWAAPVIVPGGWSVGNPELSFLLEGGLLIPRVQPYATGVANLIVGYNYLCSFVPPVDITVTSIKVLMYASGGSALLTLDVGIYNADCTSLLGSSGASVATNSGAEPGFRDYPLTASVALNKDVKYNAGVIYDDASTGQNCALSRAISDGAWRALYLAGTNTVSDYAKKPPFRRINYNPARTTLPPDASTNGNAAGGEDPPWMILVSS